MDGPGSIRRIGMLALCAALLAAGAAPARPLRKAKAAAGPVQAMPANDPRRWFTPGDYPVDALLEQQQGVVGFELGVDAGGVPSSCRVYRSSGRPLLDDATCRLARERARFKPAYRVRNVKRRRRERQQVIVRRIGPPVPSTFRRAVRWRLPNKGNVSDQTFVVRTVVQPDGSVSACTMTGPGALGGNGSCGLFGSRKFLSGMLGKDWARTKRTEVKLDLAFPAAGGAVGRSGAPDAYWLLGEASVSFDAGGAMMRCVGLKALKSTTRSTDLCQLIKAQPPRIAAAPHGRNGIYSLDLSAYFR